MIIYNSIWNETGEGNFASFFVFANIDGKGYVWIIREITQELFKI